MSRHDLTLSGLTRALTLAPRINVAPSLVDFCQQSEAQFQAIARAASTIAEIAHARGNLAGMLSADDFAVLKSFLDYIGPEYALARMGFEQRERADKQFSRDGYGHADRSKL